MTIQKLDGDKVAVSAEAMQKLEPCKHLVRTTDGKTTECDICGAIGDVIHRDWEPRWREVKP